MAAFSDYAENGILNALFGKQSVFGTLSARPALYVALVKSMPTDSSAGSALDEPVANNYNRILTNPADWNAASAGAITNLNPITFNQSTGVWGTIVGVVIVDALTGGNVIAYGALAVNKPIANSDTARFAAGTVSVSLD